MASKPLAGKLFLLTGAGSGIGRATAIKLASLGARLALTDINPDSCAQTKQLCGAGTTAYCGALDVTASEAVAACVRDVVAAASASSSSSSANAGADAPAASAAVLHGVFNCAGVNPTSYDLTDTDDAYWDKLVNTNLRGVYLVTRATMPHMATPGGAYVNVSSICGVRGFARQAIYCATKWGVVGFSKSMALELGPRGVRTNVVAPGYIDTPTNAGVVKGGDAVAGMARGNALERMGTPEEVADVVAFLFGEESRYMNGSVVEVDGALRAP
ncbi:uncharacterized protein K452DRAFT_298876 [Aplosporella prunicola CBS 121167]|uniref:Uncharacterized protein n=1 Tax=Aplosporella prunicola CBS 121167 TaxID=1176127 RepID=A0A6A6BD57_9PEZI|nr:uncharacterized protein K452DRAFT_298876 [Aplosporella prunicola CBS 121167]KAF2141518.1 hypothetical protein K452DRAFT_298876 [Aplosporella prunicola CBS 121167]